MFFLFALIIFPSIVLAELLKLNESIVVYLSGLELGDREVTRFIHSFRWFGSKH